MTPLEPSYLLACRLLDLDGVPAWDGHNVADRGRWLDHLLVQALVESGRPVQQDELVDDIGVEARLVAARLRSLRGRGVVTRDEPSRGHGWMLSRRSLHRIQTR